MIVSVPRLGRAVLCLLAVLGIGAAAPWADRDEAIAARDEIALVTAAHAPAHAPAPAPIAIERSSARPRAAIAAAICEIAAPAPPRPLLSLAPKTSPPRC